jgi:hypothetical protein
MFTYLYSTCPALTLATYRGGAMLCQCRPTQYQGHVRRPVWAANFRLGNNPEPCVPVDSQMINQCSMSAYMRDEQRHPGVGAILVHGQSWTTSSLTQQWKNASAAPSEINLRPRPISNLRGIATIWSEPKSAICFGVRRTGDFSVDVVN